MLSLSLTLTAVNHAINMHLSYISIYLCDLFFFCGCLLVLDAVLYTIDICLKFMKIHALDNGSANSQV